MFYKFDQLLNYLEVKDAFYKTTPVEMATSLKSLPKNLAMKIIYCEIAEMFLNKGKEKMDQIASVASEYGITLPSDPIEMKANLSKYLDSENDNFERSLDLLMKSASLEDGMVDSLSLSKDEYEFLKEDFLEREKYELISKMTII
jgi:hypothetical protein